MIDVETATLATQSQFAAVARALQHDAARLGLRVPAFRSPPKQAGERTLRRCPDGLIVAVRLGRDLHTVTADMIDGVLAVQGESFDEETAQALRDALWVATGEAIAS